MFPDTMSTSNGNDRFERESRSSREHEDNRDVILTVRVLMHGKVMNECIVRTYSSTLNSSLYLELNLIHRSSFELYISTLLYFSFIVENTSNFSASRN